MLIDIQNSKIVPLQSKHHNCSLSIKTSQSIIHNENIKIDHPTLFIHNQNNLISQFSSTIKTSQSLIHNKPIWYPLAPLGRLKSFCCILLLNLSCPSLDISLHEKWLNRKHFWKYSLYAEIVAFVHLSVLININILP